MKPLLLLLAAMATTLHAELISVPVAGISQVGWDFEIPAEHVIVRRLQKDHSFSRQGVVTWSGSAANPVEYTDIGWTVMPHSMTLVFRDFVATVSLDDRVDVSLANQTTPVLGVTRDHATMLGFPSSEFTAGNWNGSYVISGPTETVSGTFS